MSDANGDGKPSGDASEEAAETNTEPSKEAEKSTKTKETSEETKEQFDPAELRKREPAEEAGLSDRKKEREYQDSQYKLQFTSFSKKVNDAIADGKTLDEALEGVPVQIAGKIRKIAEGKEIVESSPKEQPDFDKIIDQRVDQRTLLKEADNKFSLIVESAGLSKSEAKAFDAETRSLEDKGLNPLEAVEYASAKLGYSIRQEVIEAEKRGLNKGLRAIPPKGESPPQPKKDESSDSEKYYMDNQPPWLKKKIQEQE